MKSLIGFILLALSSTVMASEISGTWIGEGEISWGREPYIEVYRCPYAEFNVLKTEDEFSISKTFGTCFDHNGNELTTPSIKEDFELQGNKLLTLGKQVGFIKDNTLVVNLRTANALTAFSWKISNEELSYTYNSTDFANGSKIKRKAILTHKVE